jgi:hypothetical protein
MPFLLKPDYYAQIKQDLLNVVIDAQDYLRIEAEEAAREEMEGYLRGKYDLAKIFIDLVPWHQLQQYDAGDVVHHGTITMGAGAAAVEVPLVFVASEPSIGLVPTAPAPGAPAVGPWLLKDPRQKLVKMYLIDLTLYHLHSRQNPRTVPDVRRDRYDAAIKWCQDCRTGKVSPGLPALPAIGADGQPEKESIRIRGGSQPKLRNTY